ncbi:GmrSD restriction endonuclease domain-containing protein [Rhodococcus sp. 24CO]|uniref:GmrSD restriction endonuclease domain-containing protein n=1 Tax=Rhodococcus sp. 24CO TaxID=3117460 RepID=UPI003D343E33
MSRTAISRRSTAAVSIGFVAALILGGCSSSSAAETETGSLGSGIGSGVTSSSSALTSDNAAVSAASALLAQIPIKGRAPKTGYDRALFGTAWTDDVDVEFGHNGCDTRNDILARDLTALTYKDGNRCSVQTGTLNDQYTNTTIAFTRGQDTSSAVQIDHVVALSDAWQKGAQQLDTRTRTNLANDPRNLRAVDGPANQQKSDSDASSWLPPNRGYRCQYVAAQVEVKAAYGLWVTQAEHDTIAGILQDCTGTAPTQPPVTSPPLVTSKPVVTSAPAGAVTTPFKNCAAAKAAGAAPVRIGDPGYGAHLDGDGDGVACEK